MGPSKRETVCIFRNVSRYENPAVLDFMQKRWFSSRQMTASKTSSDFRTCKTSLGRNVLLLCLTRWGKLSSRQLLNSCLLNDCAKKWRNRLHFHENLIPRLELYFQLQTSLRQVFRKREKQISAPEIRDFFIALVTKRCKALGRPCEIDFRSKSLENDFSACRYLPRRKK